MISWLLLVTNFSLSLLNKEKVGYRKKRAIFITRIMHSLSIEKQEILYMNTATK